MTNQRIVGLGGALALLAACSGGAGRDEGSGTFSTTTLTTAAATESGEASGEDTAGACEDGAACEGGVCAGGECCPSLQACGSVCCPGAQVCSFGVCVAPGAPCESAEDCDVGEYCEYALGDEGTPPAPGCVGGEQLNGACLPIPPECQGGEPLGPNGLPTCVEQCEVVPDSSDLSTMLAHEVEGPAYTAPIVIQLDDDDCDGQVTARDVPEIVWNVQTGGDYGDPSNGQVKAVSIVDGGPVLKFTYDTVLPMTQLAAGNVDGDAANGNEVVACASNGGVVALRSDGTVAWQAAAGTCGVNYPGEGFQISVPAIADLDQDGVPEVVTERAILDGASGSVEVNYAQAVDGTVAVSDVTGDGVLDIVSGSQIYSNTGVMIATMNSPGLIWPAIGDLDNDGLPEIVSVDFNARALVVWRFMGGMAQVLRAGLSLDAAGVPACPNGSGAGGNGLGGGPPTIGDFNGDGRADIGVAAGNAYVVYDGAQVMNLGAAAPDTVLWAAPTNDCSSAQTGSTLFDFDGNGRVEVVYGDQEQLRIYDGLTGEVLAMHPHPTGTINEYPVVADVDADGQADIVAITRQGCGDGDACGFLRVYGSATGGWVRTRRVWNQYTYHVTNVEEDGSIPQQELANWNVAGLNNFRQNKQPGGEFSAGDAAVALQAQCFGGYALQATVRNLGQAPLPPGALVTFFAGEAPGEVIGEMMTTTTLYPAQSQQLVLELQGPPQAELVYATVASEVPECDMNNNSSAPTDPTCVPVE